MTTYTTKPDSNRRGARTATLSLPPLPFDLPDDTTRHITRASSVPIIGDGPVLDDRPQWYSHGRPMTDYALGDGVIG